MFTTFDVASRPRVEGGGSETSAPSSEPLPAPAKPKRHQVARACDACRMHRVKCDNSVPCKNCRNRGELCSNKGASEKRTLPEAYREIERLRQKVKELEAHLEAERNASKSNSSVAASSSTWTPPSSLVLTPPESSDCPSHSDLTLVQSRGSAQRTWEGVYTSSGPSPQKSWYGPPSQFYFISRMNTYLTSVFQQLHLDDQIQLNSVAKAFASPDCKPSTDDTKSQLQDMNQPAAAEDYLTPVQEEYFLSFFWQSYHSAFPILNEVEFKDHYRSLQAAPGKPRKPSALVDIVIALSMQVGMATVSRNATRASSSASIDKDDPSIAGRLYYLRCQRLLATEMESPTLSTLQCQVLSMIYLCCAMFHNMSHTTIAIAARTAQTLGLHTEPPEDMPLAMKEMRKRIWWTLYTCDNKTSMKLGRPFATDLSSTSTSLFADGHNVAVLAGSDFAPIDENTTWLTFNLHNTKLVVAVRGVHTALYGKYTEIYIGEKGRVIYDDPAALERYASFLSSALTPLETWAREVPDAMKTKRTNNGVALSTDRSPLAIEQFAPIWLQRQRLLLELLFHNLSMSLYRPFINFPSATRDCSIPTPTAQSHATSAAHHGMALTDIMHQILSETDLLAGWHEAFQWQWNAALTLAGYLFAYPATSTASTVRASIDRSIAVFEMFGQSFAAATSAAMVMRDLATKADFIAGWTRPSETQLQAPQDTSSGLVGAGVDFTGGNSLPALDDTDFSAMQGVWSDSMDMTFSVDNSNSMDMLWPSIGNMPDDWWYNFNQANAMNQIQR